MSDSQVFTVPFLDFIIYDYVDNYTDISILKIAEDISFIKGIIGKWLSNNGFEITEEFNTDVEMMEYIHVFRLNGHVRIPDFCVFEKNSSGLIDDRSTSTINDPIPPSDTNSEDLIIEDTESIEIVSSKHDVIEQRGRFTVINAPVLTAPELGSSGENLVYNLVVKSFPTYENILVSSTAHVADIHSADLNNNIMYVYEIKNKKSLTAEDIDKFDRDLQALSKIYPDHKIIGVFISLNCPIPKIGHLQIDFDKCYLSEDYVNEECLKLVISMYSTIFSRMERPSNKVNYEIPSSVFRLLAEIRSQYNSLIASKDMYEEQLKMNKRSSAFMHDLLAKTEVQISFINYINDEFKDVLDSNDAHQELKNIDEDKLREYIRSTPRSKITKKHILETYPSITRLKMMKLGDILMEFK